MAWGLQERWGGGAALAGRRRLRSWIAVNRFLSIAAVIALPFLWSVPSLADTTMPALQSAPLPARLAIPETGAYTGGYMDFGEYRFGRAHV